MISLALIVRPPWARRIVRGEKREEFRSRPTRIRDRIGIIEAGTRTVIGEVTISDCLQNPNGGFAWILKDSLEYPVPIHYNYPKGAQTWVKLR